MMVVALNHKTAPGATEATVLGPFFAHGAKEYGYGGDLREGATMKGEDVWVSGRVLGWTEAGAQRRARHLAGQGRRHLRSADRKQFELRGRIKANDKGEYAFASYKPKFYSIPMDGPVGELVRATDNHHMRPAHMHAIVSAPGYEQVITTSSSTATPTSTATRYSRSRTRLSADVKIDDGALAKKLGLKNPYQKLEFDFRLSPDTGSKARKRIPAEQMSSPDLQLSSRDHQHGPWRCRGVRSHLAISGAKEAVRNITLACNHQGA